jgi:uncharacterized membrane protein
MAWQLTSTLAASGVAIAVAGLPLMLRRVPPNRWYGIRLPATLADERLWYAVNERSGRDLLVVGATVALLAVGAPYLLSGWWPELRALPVAVALIVGLVLVTRRATRHVEGHSTFTRPNDETRK